MTSPTVGPLAGMRVLDFTQLIAGPSAAVQLADLGAEVIKIERVVGGELGRTVGPETTIPATFGAYNRGKQALAVDMSSAQGHEIVSKLIQTADIMIEAFRPGVMDRLGFGYAAVRESRPELVYVSLSAFNPDGEGRGRPGTDAALQAESGVMAITGPPEGPPYKVGFQFVDAATGLAIGQAVCAALLQRTLTSKGSHIRLSLFEVATYMQTPSFVQASRTGEELGRPGNTAGMLGAPTDVFEVSDGYLMLVAYFPDQWIKLCNLIEMPELIGDPRFNINAQRIANKEELQLLLAPVFAVRTKQEWSKALTAAGVINAPVRSHLEILNDPGLRSLGNFERVDNGVMEPHWLPATPYRSNTWEPAAGYGPPALGEDTDATLSGLGYTPTQIADLHEAGVVSSSKYPSV